MSDKPELTEGSAVEGPSGDGASAPAEGSESVLSGTASFGVDRRAFLGGTLGAGVLLAAPIAWTTGTAGADEKQSAVVGTLAWVKPQLVCAPSLEHPYPFSFEYGGVSSDQLLPTWKVAVRREFTGDLRRTTNVAWTAPDGLVVRCEYLEFFDQYRSALDWVLWFSNTGTADTAVLSNIQAMDLRFSDPITTGTGGPYQLHSMICHADDANNYQPHLTSVSSLAPTTRDTPGLYGWSGYPSQDSFPFFKFEGGTRSLVVGLGWTGTWLAGASTGDDIEARLYAGMEITNFVLRAGEAPVRSPRVLLYANPDPVEANASFRQLIRKHYQARVGNEQLKPLVYVFDSFARGPNDFVGLHQLDPCTWEDDPDYSAASQLALLNAFKPLKIDAFHQDATWFTGPADPLNCPVLSHYGDYELRTRDYPNGLKPIADRARANGLEYGYGVWFDVDLANYGTFVEDPARHGGVDWCYPGTGSVGSYEPGRIVNLGLPEVRDFFFNKVAGFVAASKGFRTYWQDSNAGNNLSENWRLGEEPARQGIREIRHVMGLYEYWDRLAKLANGRFVRKECADGGRRLDLETVKHMHWHQTSDFTGNDAVEDQIAVWGMSHYLPNTVFDSFVVVQPGDKNDTYRFDSGIASQRALAWDPTDAGFNMARAMELRQRQDFVADCINAAWYPLTDVIDGTGPWLASQYHYPEKDRGVLIAYHRENPGDVSSLALLRGVSRDLKSRYLLHDVDNRYADIVVTGHELRMNGYWICAPESPSSTIIQYTRTRKALTPHALLGIGVPASLPTLFETLPTTVGVVMRGNFRKPTTAHVETTPPAGWTVLPLNTVVTIPAGAGAAVAVPFEITPPVGSTGTGVVRVKAISEGVTSTVALNLDVIVPAMLTSVTADAQQLVETLAQPVVVTIKAASPTRATLQLIAPAGWTVDPVTVDVDCPEGALDQAATFNVTPPFDSLGAATLQIVAVAGGQTTTVDVPATVGRRSTISASDGQAGPGEQGSITTTFFNSTQIDERDVTISVVSPSPYLTAVASAPNTFPVVPPGTAVTTTWLVTVSPDAPDRTAYTLEETADFSVSGQPTQATATSTFQICARLVAVQGKSGWNYQYRTGGAEARTAVGAHTGKRTGRPAGKWKNLPALGGALHSDNRSWLGPDTGAAQPSSISANFMAVAAETELARAWTAPTSGSINVAGRVRPKHKLDGPVQLCITKNDQLVWGPKALTNSGVAIDVAALAVSKGDVVRFEAANNSGNHADLEVKYAARFKAGRTQASG